MRTVIIDAMFMVYVVPDDAIGSYTLEMLVKAHNFRDREAVFHVARTCLTQFPPYLRDFTDHIEGPITAIYRIPCMIAHTPLEQWSE